MSAGMSQFLTNLGADQDSVRVVSISIDPEIDTVAALRAYAGATTRPQSWRFLTGTPAAVEAAQRAFGSYRGGKNNHTPGTFVRSAEDAPWIALDGFSSAETLLHASMGHLASVAPVTLMSRLPRPRLLATAVAAALAAPAVAQAPPTARPRRSARRGPGDGQGATARGARRGPGLAR